MLRGALLLALWLAPGALAHGAGPAYDPLVVEWHGFPQADGALSEAAPEPSALPFPPSNPATPGAPLRFALLAPVRFAPAGGFAVEITVRADAPVATGEGLELTIEPGGTPARVALPPVMAPGESAALEAQLAGAAGYAEGAEIALTIRALAPALAEGALSLTIGEATRLDALDMRVPSVADLRLQDAGVQAVEFLVGAETFAPSEPATVHTIRVGHGSMQAPAKAGSGNATYVLLLPEESDAEAQAHAFPDRARRIAAAHTFAVGPDLVRVHPGIGVAVRLAGSSARVACVSQCAAASFVVGAEGTAPTADRPSALIPPERETRDIPTSTDDAPAKQTPLPAGIAAGALLLALASRRRR